MADQEIRVKIGADTSAFDTGINRIATGLNDLETRTKSAGESLKAFGGRLDTLGKAMLPVSAAITAAAGGLFAIANSSAKAGNAIDKSSKAVGLSAQSYQELAFAIGQVSDLSTQQVDQAFRQLNTRLGQAAGGSQGMIDAFAEIGVTQEEIQSGAVDAEEAFRRLTTAAQDAAAPAEAAALAGRLLGEEAGKLGPILRESGGDIEALRDRAQELGIVLGDDAIQAAAGFTDGMDELSRQMGALRDQIGAELLPIIVNDLIPAIQEHVIPALRSFAEGVGDVIKWFGDLPGPVQEAVGIIAGLFAVGAPLMIAVGGFMTLIGGAVAATGPIGLFIAAAGLLSAGWIAFGDDIKSAVGGAIDYVSGKFQAMLDWLNKLIERAVAVKDAIAGALGLGAGTANAQTGIPGVTDFDVEAGRGAALGAATGAGFAAGLTGTQETTNEAVRAYLDGVQTTAEERLEVRSPSRVFARIGEFVGMGFAEGIQSTQGMVDAAVSGMADRAVMTTEGMVSSVLGSLGEMFDGSKEIAIAQAIVNAWAGATEALKLPFPANIAAFGKVLATGLGAVQKISSARPGGGGGGGSAGAAGGGRAEQSLGQVITIDFQGPDWMRDPARQMVTSLNDFIRRGGRIEGLQFQ
jgi:hypothetical protein